MVLLQPGLEEVELRSPPDHTGTGQLGGSGGEVAGGGRRSRDDDKG